MKKKKINGEFKKDLIKNGIIALCDEHQEFRNQRDIVKELKKRGIDNKLFRKLIFYMMLKIM